MFHSRMFRSVIIMIVALVFASTAYALAASNTLADAGKAGDGNNTVSGYTVSRCYLQPRCHGSFLACIGRIRPRRRRLQCSSQLDQYRYVHRNLR